MEPPVKCDRLALGLERFRGRRPSLNDGRVRVFERLECSCRVVEGHLHVACLHKRFDKPESRSSSTCQHDQNGIKRQRVKGREESEGKGEKRKRTAVDDVQLDKGIDVEQPVHPSDPLGSASDASRTKSSTRSVRCGRVNFRRAVERV